MQRKREIDRDIHQVSTYSSVTNFLNAETVPSGISTIISGGLPIDILVSPKNSDTTVFFFHGAIEPHFTLPVLSGLGISGGLEANRVFVSDPSLTLDETLWLSWYAGNYKQPDLQQSLTNIFRKIVSSLGSTRTIFFGGSGGGFASLFFARHFEDSLALVFNPQINIASYAERAVRDFVEKAFQVPQGTDDPLSQLPAEIVTNLCEIYDKPTGSKIAYLQNKNDSSHLQLHLSPFVEAVHPDTELFLMTKPWRDGHTPPPKELLTEVLNLAVSSDDWGFDFVSIGFDSISGVR